MTGSPFGEFHAAAVKGLQEILGEEQLAAVLPALADDLPAWLSALSDSLTQQYGLIPAEGILFRAGRCAFTAFIRMQGQEMGLNTLEFRLQPVLQRLAAGLAAVCKAIAETDSIALLPDELDDAYQVQSDLPFHLIPFFFAGFFQEYFEWASNGKVFLYTLESLPVDGWLLRFAKMPFDH